MHVLRTRLGVIGARHFAAYLRAHGVIAEPLADFDSHPHAPGGDQPVMLLDKSDLPKAQALLAEFESLPRDELRDDDEQVRPAMELLDQSITVRCPACPCRIHAWEDHPVCPACGVEIDCAELVADQHGPEALDECYDDDDRGGDDTRR
jgi:hypothetical protein